MLDDAPGAPQVISAQDGEILWVSGPLPGAVHGLGAARIWGIVRELAAADLVVLADRSYIGAGEHVHTPYPGRNKAASRKAVNRADAQLKPGTSCASSPAAAGASASCRSHPRPSGPRDRRMKKAHCLSAAGWGIAPV